MSRSCATVVVFQPRGCEHRGRVLGGCNVEGLGMKLLMRLFPMLLLFGTALVAWADEKTCTLASLEGGWGFALSGTLLAGPAAATGVLTVDEEGNFSGHDTLSANGTILSETFTGTVTVNPDCTTSATIVSSVVGEAHFDGVLVAKKREILLIRRDPGTVLIGSARKQ